MSTPAPISLSCMGYVTTIYPLPISPSILGYANNMCAAKVPSLVVALIVLEMILGGSKTTQAAQGEQKKWDRLMAGAMQKPPSASLAAQLDKLETYIVFSVGDWEQALGYLSRKFPEFDKALLSYLYELACLGTPLTEENIEFAIARHKKLIAHMQTLPPDQSSTPMISPP